MIIKFLKIDTSTIGIIICTILVLYFVENQYGLSKLSDYYMSVSISIIAFQSLNLAFKYYMFKKFTSTVEVVSEIKCKILPFKIVKIRNLELSFGKFWNIEQLSILFLFMLLIINFITIGIISSVSLTNNIIVAITSHTFVSLFINFIITILLYLLRRLNSYEGLNRDFPIYYDEIGQYVNKYRGTFKSNHEKIVLIEIQYSGYNKTDLYREKKYLDSLCIKFEKSIFHKYFLSAVFTVISATILSLLNSDIFDIKNLDIQLALMYFYYFLIIIGVIFLCIHIINKSLFSYSNDEIFIRQKIVEEMLNIEENIKLLKSKIDFE